MSSPRLLTILIACPVWLATAPAMAQSTGQTPGKAMTGATGAPAQTQMKSSGKKPPTPHLQTHPTAVMPLTKGECEGLGGTVEANLACGKKGQLACYTVDWDGVIRSACIDRK